MDGHAIDAFEAFLQNVPAEFSPSPAVSSTNSSTPFAAPHPSLTQSLSFSQGELQGRHSPSPSPSPSPSLTQSLSFSQGELQGHHSPSPSLSPTGSAMLEVPRSFGKPPSFRSSVNNVAEKPIQRGRHRRALSEIAFRLLDHDLILDNSDLAVSDETGEDFFSVSMDMKSSMSRNGLPLSATSSGISNTESSPVDDAVNDFDSGRSTQDARGGSQRPPQPRPPRHHHSLSMDGSLAMTEEFLMSDLDITETKKALDMDQLAELAVTDPRRAKRILANRQSAARSKERKLKYIAELEQKVQKLQTEATSLSAQLSALQRDTSGLSTQNCELKLRLQAMEQQARLRDALNETLKEEVQWLKSAAAQMGIGNGHHFCADTHYHRSNQSF